MRNKNIFLAVPSQTSLSVQAYTRDENKRLYLESKDVGDSPANIVLRLWRPTADICSAMHTEIENHFSQTGQGAKIFESITRNLGTTDIALKACYPENLPQHGNRLINLIFQAPDGLREDALQPEEQPAEAQKLFEPANILLTHFLLHVRECIE